MTDGGTTSNQSPVTIRRGGMVPGVSLNPFGRPKRGETFKDVLERIGNDPADDTRTKKEKVCAVAYDLAAKGIPWATQWIKDTVDGKAAVHIEVDHKDAALKGLSDAEILDAIEVIKARRSLPALDNTTNDT